MNNGPLKSYSFPYNNLKNQPNFVWPEGLELTVDCRNCNGEWKIKFYTHNNDPCITIEPVQHVEDMKVDLECGVISESATV
jgi:hypothetical protein